MLIKLTEDVKKSTGAGWFKKGSVLEVSGRYGERLIDEGKAKITIPIQEFTDKVQTFEKPNPQTGRYKKQQPQTFDRSADKIADNEEE